MNKNNTPVTQLLGDNLTGYQKVQEKNEMRERRLETKYIQDVIPCSLKKIFLYLHSLFHLAFH